MITRNTPSAILSTCDLYRYRLERPISAAGYVIAYFGVNPSTADALLDDHTVMKWRGFASRMKASHFIVGNAIPFRATKVKDIPDELPEQFMKANHRYLESIIEDADLLIPCWGDRNKIKKQHWQHLETVKELCLKSDKPIVCFGLTKSGDPKHPLMLGYDTPLIPFR